MKRRKEQLIPLEKSKRVIYLDQRGKEKKHPVMATIFAVLGITCLLYCLCIALFMGYGTKFFLVWGAIAAMFGIFFLLSVHPAWLIRIPFWLEAVFVTCGIVGVLFLAVVEGMILSQFGAKAEAGADYIIVLGAQWKQSGPSYVLQKRLDKAVAYLVQNPDTVVIVSGGAGE